MTTLARKQRRSASASLPFRETTIENLPSLKLNQAPIVTREPIVIEGNALRATVRKQPATAQP